MRKGAGGEGYPKDEEIKCRGEGKGREGRDIAANLKGIC